MTPASQVMRQTDRLAAIRPPDGAAARLGSAMVPDRSPSQRGRNAYRAGRLEEAIGHLREALSQGEPDGDTFALLGQALRENDELEPARRCYMVLAERYPNEPRAHDALGEIAWDNGDALKAIAHLWRARTLGSTKNLATLGDALHVIGRQAAARIVIEQAAETDRSDPSIRRRLETLPQTTETDARREFGLALLAAGLVEESEAELRAALTDAPENTDVLCALGELYRDAGQPDKAIEIYQRAHTHNPDDARIRTGLGAALAMAGRYDEALTCLEGAIELTPDLAEAHKHRAKILLEVGRTEEALAASDKARALLPDYPEAEFARAAALLRLGRFAEGWEAYESRHRLPRNVNARSTLPTWRGEPLDGGALHVIGEQGVGDTIMFGTCLADLEHCDATVSLHCQPRLVSLMARAFPWLEVTPSMPDNSTDHRAVPLGSLPRLLRRREAAFIGGAPYLRAERSAVKHWRADFAASGHDVTVGIAWRGGAGLIERAKRTTHLMDWAPLLQIGGVRFVDLQYGEHAEERATVRRRLGNVLYRPDGPDPVDDLETFAARVAALDLVISIDNTTVHFAGALGVPVWTLLPSAPSWRWLEERSDTPWYPTMRLIRQDGDESWSALLARTAIALNEFVTGNKVRTTKNETEQDDTPAEGCQPTPGSDRARPTEDGSTRFHEPAGR